MMREIAGVFATADVLECAVEQPQTRHAATAPSVNQTVELPRRLNAASYFAQFVTR
jgi:hypothetical protein